MLTQTSELALSILALLAVHSAAGPVSLTYIVSQLGSSPSYTRKVMTLLNRDRITRTRRGVVGGVELIRPATKITLLEVVELCQGKVLADFDDIISDKACAFHSAMLELRNAVREALGHWSIADLVAAKGSQHSFSCLHSIVSTGRTLHQPGPGPLVPAGLGGAP